jgi:tetratricopeptide (TPR) repeat protein
VSSPLALTLALETLAIRSRYGGADPALQLDKLRFLEARFAPQWGAMGAVAEAFGLAYDEARDSDQAIAWYRAAVSASDGSATFRAAEQLGNELAQRGEKVADAAQARGFINESIAQLERIVALAPTQERESLLGSAYKRLAMVEGREPVSEQGRAAELKALQSMVQHCAAAENLARETHAANLYYPAMNCISAELRLAWLKGRATKIDEQRLNEARRSIEQAARELPDFWSVVGQIELGLLQAVAQGQLAIAAGDLMQAFDDLNVRVSSSAPWDTVYAQARFTLEPYQAAAGAAEARAAAQVLKGLKEMAGG